jgi:hypothetical protein
MNANELNTLLQNSKTVSENQTTQLEHVLQQYPYFQAVRALHLKSLYQQKSFRYNYELKKTAAHTTDRTVLFDFITSPDFINSIENNSETEPIELIQNDENFTPEFVENNSEIIITTPETISA